MSTISVARLAPRSKWSAVFAYVVIVLGAIVMGAPFFWMVLTSFAEEAKIFAYPPMFWPNPIVLDNYVRLFREAPVAQYMLNSTVIAVLSTVGLVGSCATAAFTLARLRFPGRGLWFALILATMFIPGQVLLIPRYWVFRNIHWVDTLLPLIVPSFFGGAFGIFLLHQFFKGIPEELADAARVDGANPLKIFVLLFLPLSGPALAALAIFNFLGSWNDLLQPLIYLSSENMFTFPMALTRFRHHQSGSYVWPVILAGAFIGTIPPIVVYLMGQRHFVQGIVLSGIKG